MALPSSLWAILNPFLEISPPTDQFGGRELNFDGRPWATEDLVLCIALILFKWPPLATFGPISFMPTDPTA